MSALRRRIVWDARRSRCWPGLELPLEQDHVERVSQFRSFPAGLDDTMNVTLFVLLVPFMFGLQDWHWMVARCSSLNGRSRASPRERRAPALSKLDRDAARDNPTAPAALDPNLAWTAAADYIAAQPPGLSAIINANPGQVSVEVTSGAVPVIFVRAIGFTAPIHVRAIAVAEPRTGIVSATP